MGYVDKTCPDVLLEKSHIRGIDYSTRVDGDVTAARVYKEPRQRRRTSGLEPLQISKSSCSNPLLECKLSQAHLIHSKDAVIAKLNTEGRNSPSIRSRAPMMSEDTPERDLYSPASAMCTSNIALSPPLTGDVYGWEGVLEAKLDVEEKDNADAKSLVGSSTPLHARSKKSLLYRVLHTQNKH